MKNWFKTHSDKLLAMLSYLLTIAHIIMATLFWYRYVIGDIRALILPIVWTILSVIRILFDFVWIWLIMPKKSKIFQLIYIK